ncbi:MAG: TIGR03790 family protein [Luteolibacter sp.]
MKTRVRIVLLLVAVASVSRAAISPETVAVLYNSAMPESRKLAEFYLDARGIPQENLIALEMPLTADISREVFEKSILRPLRAEFDHRSWWKRQTDAGGVKLPVVNRIRVMVCIRGVPLRIQPTPKPAPKPGDPPPDPQNVVAGRDDASVDSELAMFGVEGLPAEGILQNKFYKSTAPIGETNLPFFTLIARIDAPTYATCERIIRDAVEVEETGLWGRSFVDIANKFPQGDQWLEAIVLANAEAGIPTVVDRFNDTLPKNYPMTEAASYFGWYDWNLSGPFLNDRFRFRKGAVAMHLHSFSGEQLADPLKNWCGGLLEKGAAVTVGNVYEPYLHLTHDFSILHQRLLAGFSWGEACWMAMPAISWQGVVLGDPMYRPFIHLAGGGMKQEGDIPYRALRAAALEWKTQPLERQKQLGKASERMKSGVLAEALGLELLLLKDPNGASKWFGQAQAHYPAAEDKLRQDFHQIAIERGANRKDEAVRKLREAQSRHGSIPEADALKGWLDILDPPPPPPADPTKTPDVKNP